jgi:hypothetical protein
MASFFEWWQQTSDLMDKETRQGFNSLIVLVAWKLWRMRNDVVFNSVPPRISQATLLVQGEAELWMLAGAKGLSALVAVRG